MLAECGSLQPELGGGEGEGKIPFLWWPQVYFPMWAQNIPLARSFPSHHDRATGVRDGVRTAGLHVENALQETIPLHCLVT